jgi:CheY-like chemotaxis protein
VIVAEDDSEMRALLSLQLGRWGYDVAAVGDGLALIQHVQRALAGHEPMPQLVISDVHMPNCDGLVALAALKRMAFAAPIVLITAFGDEELHESARRLGATAILDKPVDLRELKKLATSLVP